MSPREQVLMVPDTAPSPVGGASRQAIEHHYDVGRDFYRLWLDERMVYSCALWDGNLDDELERAQVAKLAWHADAVGAGPGGAQRVLDVGCGWGALLRYLSEERGIAQVTGLTLSSDQADACPRSEQARAVLEDWRVHQPAHTYDGIISVGAFEHFTRPDLGTEERRAVYEHFFRRCWGWLDENGRLSLQTIAWEDQMVAKKEGAMAAFFNDHIFPESSLPHLSDIVVASERRFRLVGLRNDAEQYSHTLRLWQTRLEDAKDQAQQVVGRDTYRRYLRYLRVSRAMFDQRLCTLYRLVFERRPENAATTSGDGGPGQ